MDKPPPDDFDPYSVTPPKRLHYRRKDGEEPEDSNDDRRPNDRFPPNTHEAIPVSGTLEKTVVGIVSTLVAAGIVGITTISVSTARKVDVLIDRPESVPRWQYENDMRQLKQDQSDTKMRVDRIEQRQLEGLAKK